MFYFQKLRLCAAGMFLCACALWLCAAARAERADRNQPIHIQADQWTYDDLKQVSVLTGQVVITQGTTILKGDRVVLREDPEGDYFISSTADHGKRAYFRSKRDGVDEYIEGEGKSIDYDGKEEIATLTQQAVVRRTAGAAQVIDEIHGHVIRYDRQNDVYTAYGSTDTSGKTSGRVRAILSPRTDSVEESTSVPLDMAKDLSHRARP